MPPPDSVPLASPTPLPFASCSTTVSVSLAPRSGSTTPAPANGAAPASSVVATGDDRPVKLGMVSGAVAVNTVLLSVTGAPPLLDTAIASVVVTLSPGATW